MRGRIAIFILSATVAAGPALAQWDFTGSAAVELRGFPDDPAYPGQLDGVQGSLVLDAEWTWRGPAGRHEAGFVPFLRLDAADDERTHFDLREAWFRRVGNDWELLAGVQEVFWGVTESRHLVNVINQVDAVEDIDEEDRLGQPMLQLALQRDWGRLQAFVLPGFRERTFPGGEGRLRTPLPVDTDGARYESGAEEHHVDVALRWSHVLGDWDLGAYWFRGTGREPRLLLEPAGDRLVPFYDVIQQAGVDVQYTRGAWLWKLEAIAREGQGRRFGAAVAGFERTLYGIGNSGVDLGLLFEALYDGRDDTAPVTPYDEDYFAGARVAWNDAADTSLLLGAIVDAHDGSTAAFLEAERRLGQRMRLAVESRWFLNVDPADPLSAIERDDFVTIRLSTFF